MEAIVGAEREPLPAAGPGRVRPLDDAGVDPQSVAGAPVATTEVDSVEPAEPGTTVAGVLARHGARSLVVLHRGRLAYEWYAPGADPAKPWASFSVTKSFTGTLAALAVHDGVLDRQAPVGDLLPALAGSGYGDATVGQVADMTVAVGYGEDYGDAQAGPSAGRHATFGDYIAALAPGTPVPLRTLLARIGHGDRPHGEAFAYATPDTDVLGWLLEEARGRPYVEVLRTTIWDHVGAEHDGGMTLTPDGVPLLAAGLLVTTRDLARAGQFLLDRLADDTADTDTAAGPGAGTGDGLLPGSVVESMRDGDTATFQRGGRYAYLDGYAYRDQWWLPGGPHRPLSAWGIHGQLLWVDPEAGLVVALHSAGRSPSDGRRDLDHDALCRTLTSLSAGWPTPA